jgi:hypothetical protein
MLFRAERRISFFRFLTKACHERSEGFGITKKTK